ncbi:MAG TPA: uroporphyrinogen-III synthase [Steroidobacteraceae bacterium]|nr:uroporphyrinogen-III synthase [Steroidobacteraceae bacterium]
MKASLAGITVVVTRPAAQSGPFVASLHAAGAEPIAIPALVIEPLALDPAEAPADPDWLIFTSANAVEHYPGPLPGTGRSRIAAVGRATARALAERGIKVDALPRERFDSEGLLALPQFAAPLRAKVLIVRGQGGRELLREELERRGAELSVAEVYRRRRAAADQRAHALIAEALAAGRHIVTTVTSVEILEGLLAQLPEAIAGPLRQTTLLVPGERVASAAAQLGWRGPLVRATSAEDSAMLQALKQATSHGEGSGPA